MFCLSMDVFMYMQHLIWFINIYLWCHVGLAYLHAYHHHKTFTQQLIYKIKRYKSVVLIMRYSRTENINQPWAELGGAAWPKEVLHLNRTYQRTSLMLWSVGGVNSSQLGLWKPLRLVSDLLSLWQALMATWCLLSWSLTSSGED